MKSCQKILGLLLICLAFNAFSYSYTAYPISSGKGNLIINPVLYADGYGFVGNDISLAYGLTDKLDLWSTISIGNTDTTSFTTFRTMLRYDLGSNNILACVLGNNYVSPQYHLVLENKIAGLQVNVATKLDFKGIGTPSTYAVFSPLFKVFGGALDLLFNTLSVDIFCEANPGYYKEGDFANCWPRTKGFGLDVVPGIGIGFENSLVSIACPVYDVNHKAIPTFGMWWLYIISTKK
jgi:hypothetical protein